MAFGPDTHDPTAARYYLYFEYTGHDDPNVNGLIFNLQTTIGDLQPVEAQEEAFQALVDLVTGSPQFKVINAARDYRSYNNMELPAEPEA